MIRPVKEYSHLKRMLLRELSNNARTSVTDLAKKLRCSRNTVISNLRFLEKDLGLRYTTDFNKEALGLVQRHVLRIKFDKKPELGELKHLFRDDDMAQFVAATDGDFDLFIDVVVESGERFAEWGIRTVQKLLPYSPQLYPSMIAFVHTGFIPLPDPVMENLHIPAMKLDRLDLGILMLLNSNSRQSYRQMARKLKERVETVRYRMKRIMAMNIINSFTAVVTKPPTKYNALFFVNFKLMPGLVGRVHSAERYYKSSENTSLAVNKFQFLALVTGSDLLFGLGCFNSEEEAIRDVVVAHKEIYKEDEPVINFARIKSVIKGDIAIRNTDIAKDFKPLRFG